MVKMKFCVYFCVFIFVGLQPAFDADVGLIDGATLLPEMIVEPSYDVSSQVMDQVLNIEAIGEDETIKNKLVDKKSKEEVARKKEDLAKKIELESKGSKDSDESKETPSSETFNVEKKLESEIKIEQKPLSKEFLNTSIVKRKNGFRDVHFATTLPLSGEFSVIGKEIYAGMNLVFNKVNSEGGIRGVQIKLYSLDDDNSYFKASKNIKKLLKKSPVFLSLYGLNSMLALKPYLENSQALSLFSILGSSVLRILNYQNSIYFRPSECREIEILIEYVINVRNKNDIAVFYEKSAWGEAALNVVKKCLKKYNLEPVSTGFYPANTVNINNAIDTILRGTPDVVICLASARANYNFIRSAVNHGLYRALYLGLSNLVAAKDTLSKARGIKLITTSVVPDPVKSKMQIVKEFRRDAKKFLPSKKLSHFFLEGYINAVFLVEVLKRLRPPITPGKIIKKIERLKKLSFKGLKLGYGVEPRTLSGNVWLEGVLK